MILDNADDADMYFPKYGKRNDKEDPIASYLPKTANGRILITSRDARAAEKLTGSHKTIILVPTMVSSEAMQLLQKKLDEEIDDSSAKYLVQTLDFVPLAVNQAAC